MANVKEECTYNERICMNNIPYFQIECLHCKETSMLYKYHDTYQMACSGTKNGKSFQENAKVILVCPKCDKKMQLKSLELIKLEK